MTNEATDATFDDGDEEPLVGGRNTPGVVRVGDTVRRPRTANSDFVAELLEQLTGTNLGPRFLGIDTANRDVFEFIDGHASDHPSTRASDAHLTATRMLRRLHDATSGTQLAGDAECVIHGDPGPYNTIFVDGTPRTFIDWDGAGPGQRMWDLSWLAWTWCIQHLGTVPILDQAERVRQVADTYSGVDGRALLQAIVDRQNLVERVAMEKLARLSAADRASSPHQLTVTWAAGDRALLNEHRSLFEAALRIQ